MGISVPPTILGEPFDSIAEASTVPTADSPNVAKAKIVAMAIGRRALFGPTVFKLADIRVLPLIGWLFGKDRTLVLSSFFAFGGSPQ